MGYTYVTMLTNKSHSINIIDLSELNIPKNVSSAIIEKVENLSDYLKQFKWTITFIDKWDFDNYYVIMRDRNGTSFEVYKDKLLCDLNKIIPGNIISRKCLLPMLIEIDQLKKLPQNGECVADITITLSIKTIRNK